MSVLVQEAPFSTDVQQDILFAGTCGAGLVTFTGYLRDFSEQGAIEALELEHYPGMTERVLEELGEAAANRFGLRGWRIVHRFGRIQQQEPIVWVGVLADHRSEAFAGCEFIMDTLKTKAPFWKRETMCDGRVIWVRAKSEDDEREKSWRERAREQH
jgi:molybdopterin synthase catalytic subunit